MKKKVLFLHICGPPVIRGGELSFTDGELVHALYASANLTDDYDITIICPNPSQNKQEQVINYKGVRVVCLGGSRWWRWIQLGGLSFLKQSYKHIRQEKPNIVIANNLLALFLLTLIPTKASKVGIIHHLYHTQNMNSSSKLSIRAIGILERFAIHLIKLNKIGVINPAVKETLVKEGHPEDNIVVVGNGVDIDDYPFCENKAPYSLIYVGRLAEFKEVSSLVEVALMIKKKIPDITLHIIGDGPKHSEVQRKIEELKMSHNVIMHGYLTEGEKINLLMGSAIYVSNSKLEGFGIPLVEAMATGTVPVVSDIYAHRFVFQDENVGYLVHTNEEMATRAIELLTDEPKRSQLAQNGRNLVERKWTWKRVGEKYKELLQRGEELQ
jgi:glycosyltransferase involved in cell wall biosynthesis